VQQYTLRWRTAVGAAHPDDAQMLAQEPERRVRDPHWQLDQGAHGMPMRCVCDSYSVTG